MARKSATQSAAPTANAATRSRAAKKPTVQEQSDSELNLEDEDDAEEDESEEEQDVDKDDEQLLSMLKELRKKSTKSTSRASARQKQVSVACNQHRQSADLFVREMNAYIDKISGDALEMADTTGAAARALSEGARQWGDTYSAISAANGITVSTKGGLPTRRADEINAACAQIEVLPVRQAKVHRRLLRMVKQDFARLLEEEQVASDASALIKKFKDLLH